MHERQSQKKLQDPNDYSKLVIITLLYKVFHKKCTSLMHHSFTTASHQVTQFFAKMFRN